MSIGFIIEASVTATGLANRTDVLSTFARFETLMADDSARNSDPNPMSASEAKVAMAQLDQELNRLQRAIRLAIQAQLSTMVGRSMGDLEQNRNLAESIHRLLDSHGLRIQCSECGHPAILRVSPRKGASRGVFVFDHTIEGRRTFHGGRSSVPPIRLVAKPPRKKGTERAAG